MSNDDESGFENDDTAKEWSSDSYFYPAPQEEDSWNDEQEAEEALKEELPEGWVSYYSVEGWKYYYNATTEQSSWEFPSIPITSAIASLPSSSSSSIPSIPSSSFLSIPAASVAVDNINDIVDDDNSHSSSSSSPSSPSTTGVSYLVDLRDLLPSHDLITPAGVHIFDDSVCNNINANNNININSNIDSNSNINNSAHSDIYIDIDIDGYTNTHRDDDDDDDDDER